MLLTWLAKKRFGIASLMTGRSSFSGGRHLYSTMSPYIGLANANRNKVNLEGKEEANICGNARCRITHTEDHRAHPGQVSRVHQPDKGEKNLAYHALLAFLNVKLIKSFTKKKEEKAEPHSCFPKH